MLKLPAPVAQTAAVVRAIGRADGGLADGEVDPVVGFDRLPCTASIGDERIGISTTGGSYIRMVSLMTAPGFRLQA